MFKRKKKITTKTNTILQLSYFESDLECFEEQLKNLEKQTVQLEQKVKQLECKHNFKFDCCRVIGIWGQTNIVYHKCTECNKVIVKEWDSVAKKGQQALKLLNLVPKDWKVKGDNK